MRAAHRAPPSRGSSSPTWWRRVSRWRRRSLLERHKRNRKRPRGGGRFLQTDLTAILCLRLRLHAAGSAGARARLAGGRHGRAARRWRLDHRFAVRPLAVEEVLDLVAREGLELEQRLGDLLPVVALLGDDAPRLLLARLDQTADLGVDLLSGLVGDVRALRHRMAQKNLLLVALVAHTAELVG